MGQGVTTALKRAPRDVRCLLWLAALHLLVMGVFPQHLLLLADNSDGAYDEASSRKPDLLRWPKEWLSPGSGAGERLSASGELRVATTNTFMSALQDVGLLPSENGGGGWAPPLRVRDALLPSAVEARAARLGGMAPEPSALQGPSLALALNWLAFCSRRGSGQAKGVRTVALACCRRFQLARPDHPAMLEHLLLEHDVSKARSLNDVYREVLHAYGKDGAAAVAVRERGENGSRDEDGSGGGDEKDYSLLSPSGGCLQAFYAFFRSVEVRLKTAELKSAAGMSADGAVSEAAAAADRDTEVARSVIREALVCLWTTMPVPNSLPDRGLSAPDRRLLEEGGELLSRAVEGAKASLFCWADGGAGNVAGKDGDKAGLSEGNTGRSSGHDMLSAERQLSTIFFALWVLGGPSAATGALDHLLSAESFSNMSPERRRLAWLHRLEAAVVLSDQQVSRHGRSQYGCFCVKSGWVFCFYYTCILPTKNAA